LDVVDQKALDAARRSLGECMLFRGLSPDERKGLVAQARIRNFAAGDTIFLMGSSGDSMMAVLEGTVRVSVPSPEGKEIVLAILQPGELLGEIAVLDGKERTADARAMTACSLGILERRAVLTFLGRHPTSWLRFIEVLCKRLRLSDQQIAEMVFLDLPARLAKALLRMSSVASGRTSTRIQLSQRELGNMVGSSRESINKCLREWQRKGFVRVDENEIIITKRAALKALSDGHNARTRNDAV
jgi:CRP/FNR family transcriptional regulator, cyclic AMP receptor protein